MNLRDTIIDHGANGYWKLSEYRGSTCFDYSNNARHLTVNGNPIFERGYLATDWHSDSMLFGDLAHSLSITATHFRSNTSVSASALIQALNVTNDGLRCIIRCGTESAHVWSLYQSGANLICIYNNAGAIQVIASNVLSSMTRTHIAFTRASDGKTYKFYVNGSLVHTATAASAPSIGSPALVMSIGNDASSQPFKGLISDIAVFPTELEAWQIALQYAAAIRTWPSTIPQVFEPANYNEKFGSLSLITKMTYGAPKSRPILSSNYSTINGTIELLDSERDILEVFYYDGLENGTCSFEGSLSGEGDGYLFAFLAPPTFKDIEGAWEASMQMMVLPQSRWLPLDGMGAIPGAPPGSEVADTYNIQDSWNEQDTWTLEPFIF